MLSSRAMNGVCRCCADASPACFAGLLHFGVFPLQGCLHGCLTLRRPLVRRPLKVEAVDVEWITEPGACHTSVSEVKMVLEAMTRAGSKGVS